MTPKQLTLFAIFAFIALTLGSFIWFIVTWDPGKEEPVVQLPVMPNVEARTL